MAEILERYILYNAHAASYTWKYNGKNLKMDATLAENGIVDEDEQFYELGMNDDQYLQAIHLYFNDDLTEAWCCVPVVCLQGVIMPEQNSVIKLLCANYLYAVNIVMWKRLFYLLDDKLKLQLSFHKTKVL